MTPEDRERYIRWQGYRVAQLSYSMNLFLGFAVASLAYAISMKIDGKQFPSNTLDTIIIWWAVSAALGVVATITKLLDYRHTAIKIREGGHLNSEIAKYCGYVTWGAFWAQVVTYSWGAFLFISAVIGF